MFIKLHDLPVTFHDGYKLVDGEPYKIYQVPPEVARSLVTSDKARNATFEETLSEV